jgi:pilus assembly protein Flp/PilA
MKFLVEKVSDFLTDEQGATAVEYGIFVALIAAVIVTLVSNIGGKIKDAFQSIYTALGG